jgi:hypothetical protein
MRVSYATIQGSASRLHAAWVNRCRDNIGIPGSLHYPVICSEKEKTTQKSSGLEFSVPEWSGYLEKCAIPQMPAKTHTTKAKRPGELVPHELTQLD